METTAYIRNSNENTESALKVTILEHIDYDNAIVEYQKAQYQATFNYIKNEYYINNTPLNNTNKGEK